MLTKVETLSEYSMKAKGESQYDIVSKIPLLNNNCTPAQKSFLNNSAACNSYKKDDLVFHENFPAYYIYFVASGIIGLWKENIFLKKQYIRFVKEGELFGYRGSAIENSTYRLSASAFEDSKIYCIRKKDIIQVLKENTELHFNIMSVYVKELEKIETNFCYHIAMNTREKIAEALLTIYNIYGCNEEAVPFSKAILRKDIADIAGISVGKTINMLTEFRAEKIIDTCGSTITLLSKDKLNEIVMAYHNVSEPLLFNKTINEFTKL